MCLVSLLTHPASNIVVTLKSGLGVTHSGSLEVKWYRSKPWARFPIRIPYQLGPYYCRFDTIHERDRHPRSLLSHDSRAMHSIARQKLPKKLKERDA